MFLKIMDATDTPDNDSRGTYQILDGVAAAKFERDGKKAIVKVTFFDSPGEEAEALDVPGNAYVMNAEGVTVSSFGSAPYHRGPRETGL